MAEILLYHHAQGLTKGVEAFAGELRQAGHTVHLPDLYDGHVFDTLDEGIAYASETGFDTLMERGVAAAAGLGNELVYAGFSLGVMPAQRLAQTREGAKGALLFHSCVPVSEFGEAWPAGVPVQVHGMDADPFFVGEAMSTRPAPLSTPPTRPSCSFIPATSTSSPTPRCPATTRPRPRCSPAGSSTSSANSTGRGRDESAGRRGVEHQHELPAQVTVFADAVRLRDLGERECLRDGE